VAGLHSLYMLAATTSTTWSTRTSTTLWRRRAVDSLRSYYAEAQRLYGVDASYFASINYIESLFGRINGPSSAGQRGRCNSSPDLAAVRQRGNIMDPHDAILAAAVSWSATAPGNMRQRSFTTTTTTTMWTRSNSSPRLPRRPPLARSDVLLEHDRLVRLSPSAVDC